jgi:transcriptional regulator with XRE-family HTH domain
VHEQVLGSLVPGLPEEFAQPALEGAGRFPKEPGVGVMVSIDRGAYDEINSSPLAFRVAGRGRGRAPFVALLEPARSTIRRAGIRSYRSAVRRVTRSTRTEPRYRRQRQAVIGRVSHRRHVACPRRSATSVPSTQAVDIGPRCREVVLQMVDSGSAGERVARYRYRRQMTQDELAEASGLSLSAVKSIERGVRTGRLFTLNRLARALGVTTSDLLAPAAGASVVGEPGPDALFEIRRSLTPPLDAATAFAEDQVPKAGGPPGRGTDASAWAQTLAYAERLYEQDRYDDVLAAVPTLLDEARALQQTDPAEELPLAQAYLYAAEILIQVRRLDLAQHALDKAMQIAQRISDEMLATWVVRSQCWVLLRQDRKPEVEALAVQTADLIEPQMSTSSP